MKQTIIIILICGLSANLFAQTEQDYSFEERNCFTVGVLQGGGSLLGADIEFLLTDQLGFQVGAGFVGFGVGINYHLNPSIRSSFISLQY